MGVQIGVWAGDLCTAVPSVFTGANIRFLENDG